ncbi:hypothetical protein FRC08_001126 [Ceratobasidium sp. 394]|nr:hypothetical protein FRC08_001126 [Ceratobasidium sp. 394]
MQARTFVYTLPPSARSPPRYTGTKGSGAVQSATRLALTIEPAAWRVNTRYSLSSPLSPRRRLFVSLVSSLFFSLVLLPAVSRSPSRSAPPHRHHPRSTNLPRRLAYPTPTPRSHVRRDLSARHGNRDAEADGWGRGQSGPRGPPVSTAAPPSRSGVSPPIASSVGGPSYGKALLPPRLVSLTHANTLDSTASFTAPCTARPQRPVQPRPYHRHEREGCPVRPPSPPRLRPVDRHKVSISTPRPYLAVSLTPSLTDSPFSALSTPHPLNLSPHQHGYSTPTPAPTPQHGS